jgi:hypothetical protein
MAYVDGYTVIYMSYVDRYTVMNMAYVECYYYYLVSLLTLL